MFVLNANFRQKVTLILFSEWGVSLLATQAIEQEECSNLSLTPMPCEEKEKLWRLFPFSVPGPSWQGRQHSQQKPNSFAVPAVGCGARGFVNPDPTPAVLERGLAASQRQFTAPFHQGYLEPGLSWFSDWILWYVGAKILSECWQQGSGSIWFGYLQPGRVGAGGWEELGWMADSRCCGVLSVLGLENELFF